MNYKPIDGLILAPSEMSKLLDMSGREMLDSYGSETAKMTTQVKFDSRYYGFRAYQNHLSTKTAEEHKERLVGQNYSAQVIFSKR